MLLQRYGVFPLDGVALITSIKECNALPKQTTKEAITLIAEKWKPYQTIAAFILWHGYLSKRKRHGYFYN